MNAYQFLAGESTHYATALARTSICGQLGFNLANALNQERRNDETPVADRKTTLRDKMLSAMGAPRPEPMNAEQLANGMAAAFTLCARWLTTPDPETGRLPEGMRQYISTPAHWIMRGADYDLSRQLAQVKATAAALNAKPEATAKRVEELTTVITKQANDLAEASESSFESAVNKLENVDDETLIHCAVDALEAAYKGTGRNVRAELKNAAAAILDSQRKRFEGTNAFVKVDVGVYAMAQMDPPASTTEPETVTA